MLVLHGEVARRWGAGIAIRGGVVGCPLDGEVVCGGRAGSQLQQCASSGPESSVGKVGGRTSTVC